MKNQREDKLKGCFLGLVIGDAMGAPVEFMQPGSFEPVIGYRSGGAHEVRAGEWTDDTSMALAIADAMIQRQGVIDPKLVLDNFVAWLRQGRFSSRGYCFDVGLTIRKALVSYQSSGEVVASTTRITESGNGSLMRMAPVFFSPDDQLIENALTLSRTTHTSPLVDEYVIKFCSLIGDILAGHSKEELAKKYPYISNSRSTGFVVDSYNVALCSFFTTKSFEEGLLLTVNQGLDADTVGAIYGQLAGAFYGYKAIPEKLVKNLYMTNKILETIQSLWETTNGNLRK